MLTGFMREIQVQDAGTQQGLNVGTLFSRSLRLPPIWIFKVAATCPRATYAAVTTGARDRGLHTHLRCPDVSALQPVLD